MVIENIIYELRKFYSQWHVVKGFSSQFKDNYDPTSETAYWKFL